MNSPLQELINAFSQNLDIRIVDQRKIEEIYRSLSGWLAEHYEGQVDLAIYPQGSFRLGTVVAPIADGGQFDLDFVYLRDLKLGSISQDELRLEVGDQLRAACEHFGWEEPIELGRCWRLDFFEDGFHFDVLPSIPDERVENGIRLSDKDLKNWLFSNPIDYANWFYEQMSDREVQLASAKNIHVEGVPEFPVRTTLQRVVQLLKRSRDEFFGNRTDAPPSILITTLAAHVCPSDKGEGESFRHAVSALDNPVELRGDEYWVANPAHGEENFADKWNTEPSRMDAFNEWLSWLRSNLSDFDIALTDARKFDLLQDTFGDVASYARPEVREANRHNLSLAARGGALAPDEELVEDIVPVELTGTVDVALWVEDVVGDDSELRPRRQLRRRRIEKLRAVEFRVTSTTVAEPFEIWWKIRNHGAAAKKTDNGSGLRGQIHRTGELVRSERTSYKGEHYAECYVVKDGVCRARQRTWVAIE